METIIPPRLDSPKRGSGTQSSQPRTACAEEGDQSVAFELLRAMLAAGATPQEITQAIPGIDVCCPIRAPIDNPPSFRYHAINS